MRADGIRVHDEDPMYDLIPQFLTKRYDAMNMVTVDIPLQPLRDYMNRKRKEGRPISHLALILSAYARIANEFPKLNRFISGNKKIYQHKDFQVAMVVLRPNGEDTMSKIPITPDDNIFSVQNTITEYISKNRERDSNALDKAMKIILHFGVLVNIAGSVIRFTDRHGLLPGVLCNASPFHASLLISNLASIRTNHIYHHVYDFGTTSVGITMGNPRYVPRITKDGIVHDKCMPLGVVMDERIASGHYFAQAFARLKIYLADPELLELPFGQSITKKDTDPTMFSA